MTTQTNNNNNKDNKETNVPAENNNNNNNEVKEAKTKLPLNVLNNYFSIGADAKIALDFHSAREKNPELFTSQAFNKIEYARVGLFAIILPLLWM